MRAWFTLFDLGHRGAPEDHVDVHVKDVGKPNGIQGSKLAVSKLPSSYGGTNDVKLSGDVLLTHPTAGAQHLEAQPKRFP